MKILFTKSKWEWSNRPLEAFLDQVAEEGYDGVELYLPDLPESPDQIRQLLEDRQLLLVAQIITWGDTPGEHLQTLRDRFQLAVDTAPLLVNSHTGREIYPFEENLKLFAEACRLSESSGLPFCHETHRGRPTFNAVDTRRYLEALPELRLAVDFSHWHCVHESDLRDQPENIDLAIQRAIHVHARVGFAEGPQVSNPLSPASATDLENAIELWERVMKERKSEGADFLTVTPEFGPKPYMPLNPHTGEPVADAWETNARFHAYLRERWSVPDAQAAWSG